jgi:hypothetical protein
LADRGDPYEIDAATAKLFASETATKAALDAIQICGSTGYTKDLPVERYLRDAKMLELDAGSSQSAAARHRTIGADRRIDALRLKSSCPSPLCRKDGSDGFFPDRRSSRAQGCGADVRRRGRRARGRGTRSDL